MRNLCLFLGLLLASCVSSRKISQLRFVGQYVVPHRMAFGGTVIGGLSGIDYDKERKVYYLISDDRSVINPARFYTAAIDLGTNGITSVRWLRVDTLRYRDGQPYPAASVRPFRTPDPEAIRLNTRTGKLYWSSEGERIVTAKDTILEDPAITIASMDGRYVNTVPLPDNLHMQVGKKGPRRNSTLEGLTFSDEGKTLYASMEEPLYEDGPVAGVGESKADIRIYKFNAKGRNTIQYLYRLEPVAYAPDPIDSFKINGVSDILYVGKKQLLVTERSSSYGRPGFFIKVFLADLRNAKSVSKRLLVNMEKLPVPVDNIEGAVFGPRLPNGHRSLIFVSDDNFNEKEITQFLLFEVIP